MRIIVLNIAMVAVVFGLLSRADAAHDAALHDALFFNGWVLFAGMAIQLLLRLKAVRPSWIAGARATWVRIHSYLGLFVVLVFGLHTSWSRPDAAFEWVLWILFVVVALSGILGAWLNRAIPFRLEQQAEWLAPDVLLQRKAKIAQQAADLALGSVEKSGSLAISNFYADQLHGFFHHPQNRVAHLRTSLRPMRQLVFQLQCIGDETNDAGQRIVSEITQLAEAKNRLDFQYAHEAALKAWLFLHVPATYALIVLSLLHVAIVYAFTAGA